MLKLRPYKACDAQAITKWLKNEYAFRQWSWSNNFRLLKREERYVSGCNIEKIVHFWFFCSPCLEEKIKVQ